MEVSFESLCRSMLSISWIGMILAILPGKDIMSSIEFFRGFLSCCSGKCFSVLSSMSMALSDGTLMLGFQVDAPGGCFLTAPLCSDTRS